MAATTDMNVFPTGAWYFERDFPDPSNWVPDLRELPPSSTLAKCITAIYHISTVMSGLSQPAMNSEDESDSGEDELPDESLPVVIKIKRANPIKKGQPPEETTHVEHKPPVRERACFLVILLILSR